MNLVLLLVFGSIFSLTDVTRHVIGNRNLVMFISLIVVIQFISKSLADSFAFFLKASFFILLLQWLTGGVLGMGDAKYLAALALLIGKTDIYMRGVGFFAFFACLSALVIFAWRHSWCASVPLAPAITAGFLWVLI